MVVAVEYRFGQVTRLPVTIEWLSDNGSCYVAGDAAGSGQESSWLPDHSSREQDRRVCQAEVDQDRRPLA